MKQNESYKETYYHYYLVAQYLPHALFVYAGVHDVTSSPLALTPSLTRSLGEFAQDVTEHGHGSRGGGSS